MTVVCADDRVRAMADQAEQPHPGTKHAVRLRDHQAQEAAQESQLKVEDFEEVQSGALRYIFFNTIILVLNNKLTLIPFTILQLCIFKPEYQTN